MSCDATPPLQSLDPSAAAQPVPPFALSAGGDATQELRSPPVSQHTDGAWSLSASNVCLAQRTSTPYRSSSRDSGLAAQDLASSTSALLQGSGSGVLSSSANPLSLRQGSPSRHDTPARADTPSGGESDTSDSADEMNGINESDEAASDVMDDDCAPPEVPFHELSQAAPRALRKRSDTTLMPHGQAVLTQQQCDALLQTLGPQREADATAVTVSGESQGQINVDLQATPPPSTAPPPQLTAPPLSSGAAGHHPSSSATLYQTESLLPGVSLSQLMPRRAERTLTQLPAPAPVPRAARAAHLPPSADLPFAGVTPLSASRSATVSPIRPVPQPPRPADHDHAPTALEAPAAVAPVRMPPLVVDSDDGDEIEVFDTLDSLEPLLPIPRPQRPLPATTDKKEARKSSKRERSGSPPKASQGQVAINKDVSPKVDIPQCHARCTGTFAFTQHAAKALAKVRASPELDISLPRSDSRVHGSGGGGARRSVGVASTSVAPPAPQSSQTPRPLLTDTSVAEQSVLPARPGPASDSGRRFSTVIRLGQGTPPSTDKSAVAATSSAHPTAAQSQPPLVGVSPSPHAVAAAHPEPPSATRELVFSAVTQGQADIGLPPLTPPRSVRPQSTAASAHRSVVSSALPRGSAVMSRASSCLDSSPVVPFGTTVESVGLPMALSDAYAQHCGVRRLYPWQRACLQDYYQSTDGQCSVRCPNLLYTAPTSGGKTAVAELIMFKTVIDAVADHRARVLATDPVGALGGALANDMDPHRSHANPLQAMARPPGGKAMFVVPYVAIAEEKAAVLEHLAAPLRLKVQIHAGGQGRRQLGAEILVCTVEKANILLNMLLEQGREDELGVVVIDELHQIGDAGRGHVVESLVTKLLHLSHERSTRHLVSPREPAASDGDGCTASIGARVTPLASGRSQHTPGQTLTASSITTPHRTPPLRMIGMSATLANAASVAHWFGGARLFVTDFRPVPLSEHYVVDGVVHNSRHKPIRHIMKEIAPPPRGAPKPTPPEGSIPSQGSAAFDAALRRSLSALSVAAMFTDGSLLTLATEGLGRGYQCLVFCPSRQQCQTTAHLVSRFVSAPVPPDPNGAASTAAELKDRRTDASSDDNTRPTLHSMAHPKLGSLASEARKSVVKTLRDSATDATRGKEGEAAAPGVVPTSLSGMVSAAGVAFHHAALTSAERTAVEKGFREGAVWCLCCTTTLAAGVNLPARRVLFQSPRIAASPLDGVRYAQAAGRAGRSGLDERGEAYLLGRGGERALMKSLVSAVLPPVGSNFSGSKQGLLRPLLEAITTGHCNTVPDVHAFVGRTLLAATASPAVATTTATKALEALETWRFITWRVPDPPAATTPTPPAPSDAHAGKTGASPPKEPSAARAVSSEPAALSPPAGSFEATPLGQATMAAAMSPDDALTVYSALERAQRQFVLQEALHGIFLCTPLQHGIPTRWQLLYDRLSSDPGVAAVAAAVGIDEGYVARATATPPPSNLPPPGAPLYIGCPSAPQPCKDKSGNQSGKEGDGTTGATSQQQRVHQALLLLALHRRFFAALVLTDVASEVPVPIVAQRYGIAVADLHRLMEAAGAFCSMVGTFAQRLGLWYYPPLLEKLQPRLQRGAAADIVPLLKIAGLSAWRARELYKKGFTTVLAIAMAPEEQLRKAVSLRAPFQSNQAAQGGGQSPARPVGAAPNVLALPDSASNVTGLLRLLKKGAVEALKQDAAELAEQAQELAVVVSPTELLMQMRPDMGGISSPPGLRPPTPSRPPKATAKVSVTPSHRPTITRFDPTKSAPSPNALPAQRPTATPAKRPRDPSVEKAADHQEAPPQRPDDSLPVAAPVLVGDKLGNVGSQTADKPPLLASAASAYHSGEGSGSDIPFLPSGTATATDPPPGGLPALSEVTGPALWPAPQPLSEATRSESSPLYPQRRTTRVFHVDAHRPPVWRHFLALMDALLPCGSSAVSVAGLPAVFPVGLEIDVAAASAGGAASTFDLSLVAALPAPTASSGGEASDGAGPVWCFHIPNACSTDAWRTNTEYHRLTSASDAPTSLTKAEVFPAAVRHVEAVVADTAALAFLRRLLHRPSVCCVMYNAQRQLRACGGALAHWAQHVAEKTLEFAERRLSPKVPSATMASPTRPRSNTTADFSMDDLGAVLVQHAGAVANRLVHDLVGGACVVLDPLVADWLLAPDDRPGGRATPLPALCRSRLCIGGDASVGDDDRAAMMGVRCAATPLVTAALGRIAGPAPSVRSGRTTVAMHRTTGAICALCVTAASLLPRLRDSKLLATLFAVEIPVTPTLALMELVGAAFQPSDYEHKLLRMSEKCGMLEQEAFAETGRTGWALSAPKQCAEMLFDVLKLPSLEGTGDVRAMQGMRPNRARRIETRSTKAAVLRQLQRMRPDVRLPFILQEHRTLSGWPEKYMEPLVEFAKRGAADCALATMAFAGDGLFRLGDAAAVPRPSDASKTLVSRAAAARVAEGRTPRSQRTVVHRVYGCFFHTATATGRLAMSDPNLQTIPHPIVFAVGDDEVRLHLRRAFVATHCYLPAGPSTAAGLNDSAAEYDGVPRYRVLLAADYAQVEARILAHCSGDPALIAAFRDPTHDVFVQLAARVFGKRAERDDATRNVRRVEIDISARKPAPELTPLGTARKRSRSCDTTPATDRSDPRPSTALSSAAGVTPEERQQAKALLYGMVYGKGAGAIAEDLEITVEAAEAVLSEFRAAYPEAVRWTERVAQQTAQRGYVETLTGRRRWLRNASSKEDRARAAAARAAVNTVCQGTAADIIRVAMARITAGLQALAVSKYNAAVGHSVSCVDGVPAPPIARLVLQVHDELLFEVDPRCLRDVAALVRRCMADTTTLGLRVPFPVKLRCGPNWDALTPLDDAAAATP